MCIIAGDVKDVSSTNIAVFHVGYILHGSGSSTMPDPKPSQLVVYSAEVDSLVDQNAFILPVYNPSNKTENIIPLDMSELKDFFSDLDKIFQKWFPRKVSKNWSTNGMASFAYDSMNYLPVHQVGDYKFSIMANKTDFDRIDKSQLNIDPVAKISIDAHSNDYSFIIYQFFQKGKIDISPFGYLCVPETDNSMIIPTIHGHPSHDLPNINIGYIVNTHVNFKPTFENIAEYDHKIYAVIKCPANMIDQNKLDVSESDLKSLNGLLKKITTDYKGNKIRMFVPKCFIPEKIEIKKKTTNRNMQIDTDGPKFIYDLVMDKY